MKQMKKMLAGWLVINSLALLVSCGGSGSKSSGEESATGNENGAGQGAGANEGNGSGSDSGSDSGSGSGSGSIDAQASALVSSIMDGNSPEEAFTATKMVLSRGGIGVDETGSDAEFPAAGWVSEPRLAFNSVMELRDRAVSGRFTLDDVANMWADFEFPFQGNGTPGEQLLTFLQIWLTEAVADPNGEGQFPVLFIAEMALRQEPPVELLDPDVKPEDLRLSLLEIELLIAAFDRAFQSTVTTSSSGLSSGPSLDSVVARRSIATVRTAAMAEGVCDGMKKFFGTIGTKAHQEALSHAGGHLSDKALGALGLSGSEIGVLKGTVGKVFSALDAALKVAKMIQMYASSQVVLTVKGINPVNKPSKDGPRVLVPVEAQAGVPDEAWQEYQKNSGGQGYQNMKSCLDYAGMPLPGDLKDIADNVGNWRIKWNLVKGSPKHALIPSDVNTFNAPGPFGMKLVSGGAGSATATLKVDITEEPELATFFRGPYIEDTVRVKAEVFTAEPPSPSLLLGTMSLVGTLSSLLELSTGWVQTGMPPASTATIRVKYHAMPETVTAYGSVYMRYNYSHFRGDPAQSENTAAGSFNFNLIHSERELNLGGINNKITLDQFTGNGLMNYHSASTKKINKDPDDDCSYDFSVVPMDGSVTVQITSAYNAGNGSYLPNYPYQLAIGYADAGNAPQEQITETITCPGDPPDVEVINFPPIAMIMTGALNATNMVDDKIFLLPGGKFPGVHLTNKEWTYNPGNGSVQTLISAPMTVSTVAAGVASDVDILEQNTTLRLTPVFVDTQ